MSEAAEIRFPYCRTLKTKELSDVDFGRYCVSLASRAGGGDQLGHAVEALSRAVVAEAVARLAVSFASPDQLRDILAAVAGDGRRGPP